MMVWIGAIPTQLPQAHKFPMDIATDDLTKDDEDENAVSIGTYTRAERREKIARYRSKRAHRVYVLITPDNS